MRAIYSLLLPCAAIILLAGCESDNILPTVDARDLRWLPNGKGYVAYITDFQGSATQEETFSGVRQKTWYPGLINADGELVKVFSGGNTPTFLQQNEIIPIQNGDKVLVELNNTIEAINLGTGSVEPLSSALNGLFPLAVSPDGRMLLARETVNFFGDEVQDRQINLIDLQQNTIVRTWTLPNATREQRVIWLNNGLFALGSIVAGSSFIDIYDTLGNRQYFLPNASMAGHGAGFASATNKLYYLSNDQRIIEFDVNSYSTSLIGPDKAVYSLDVTADGTTIAYISDNTRGIPSLYVLDKGSGSTREIYSFADKSVVISPDQQHAAFIKLRRDSYTIAISTALH